MGEVIKLKDLYTRPQLLEKSGPVGQLKAVDLKMGQNIHFEYGEGKGLKLMTKDQTILPFGKEAIAALFNGIGVPLNFALDTPTDLVLPVLNYYYREKFEGLPVRFLCNKDTVSAIAFQPTDEFVGLQDLLNAIEAAVDTTSIAGYHKPVFNFGSMIINVVLTETFEVVTKDPLNIGIRFVHPIASNQNTQISAYTFRQFCSNGAITMDDIRSWSRKNGTYESFRKWVPSVVIEARAALAEEKNRLHRLTEIKTDSDTSRILESVLEDGGIKKSVREEIRSRAVDKPPRTLYDLWNIPTAEATHSQLFEEHPSMLGSLENTAGELALNSQLCPTCHHKL